MLKEELEAKPFTWPNLESGRSGRPTRADTPEKMLGDIGEIYGRDIET
jgi:hypothetical protein